MLKERGFTLTELMVGSTVGLIVVAGALQLYMLNLRAATDNLRLSRLNQELRATLDLLHNDLHRAGYWSFAPGVDSPADNPFQNEDNRLRLGHAPGENDASCILYSYDANADGRVGVGAAGSPGLSTSTANLEQFGFRLRNGQVQMRNGGGSFDCRSGSWQAITDPDTEITTLHFALTETCSNLRDPATACASGAPALLQRRVTLAIDGHSRSDSRVHQQLTSTVAIANDLLLAVYP